MENKVTCAVCKSKSKIDLDFKKIKRAYWKSCDFLFLSEISEPPANISHRRREESSGREEEVDYN